MDISLTPELEEFVTQKVKGGLYQKASDVVREGLQLLRARDDDIQQKNREELRRDLALGIAEADAGKLAPLNAQETLTGIRQKWREEARQP